MGHHSILFARMKRRSKLFIIVCILALYGVLYIKHVEINTPLIPLTYAIYQKGCCICIK